MNRNILLALLGCMLIATNGSAQYTVDGDLSDWGVDPFVDWVPDSPTADWAEEDYDGTNPEPGPTYPNPYGGELFDYEAMYFDDYYDGVLGGMAYFATVTSIGPDGYGSYVAGDLALDTNDDGDPEYGIKLVGPDKGQVCLNPNWISASDITANDPTSFTCDGPSSVVTGMADVAYVNAGIKDYPAGCTSGPGCLDNYIVEVAVKKVYIGLPEMGETSQLHITQSCGNDAIDIDIDWDYQLPEFASMLAPLFILLTVPSAAYVMVKKRS